MALVAAIFMSTSIADGQVVISPPGADDPSKRTGGFSVLKEESKTSEALAEFERYCSKEAWEKAFGALEQVSESAGRGLVAIGDGFYLPSRVRLRQALIKLPPQGRQAYRLFNDAKARQLFEQLQAAADDAHQPSDAQQPLESADEQAQLQDLLDLYFISSIGDRIADRLGDAKFEQGDFAGAAACWEAILVDYPDTSLSRLRLSTKRAIALARAGRWDEFDSALSQIREKYSGQSVRLGGREAEVVSLLEELSMRARSSAVPATAPASTGRTAPLKLPSPDDPPLWQSLFADEAFFKQLGSQINNAGWGMYVRNPATVVPASAVDEKRVYLNWFGVAMAIDAQTGKLLWRTEPFTGVAAKLQQKIQQGSDAEQGAIAVSPDGGRVLMVRDQPAAAFGRPGGGSSGGSLICLSAVDGKRQWGTDSGALSGWIFSGQPMISGDTIYTAARQASMALNLLAISVEDGKLLWKLPLGTFSAVQNWRGMMVTPEPALRQAGSTLYVLTSNGAVLAVNLPARRVEWAFTHDTPAAPNREMMFYPRAPEKPSFPAAIELADGTLFIKDKGNRRLYALDPTGPSLKWNRPVDSNTTIVGIRSESSSLLMLGDGLDCIDLGTRDMRWSTKTPMDTGNSRPLVIGSHAYVLGSRGVYDLDLTSGEMKIFRVYDREGIGGAVWRAGGRLICVSNRAVTAYALDESDK